MLKYRDFLDLTDDEIRFILNDILQPTKIENIQRDTTFQEITATITTGGWETENGVEEIEDVITLSVDGIDVDFSLTIDDENKWKKFLLAKGCDKRLKDNPYLSEGR